MTTEPLTPKPTQEQIDRWPSCRIMEIMHYLEAALDAADSTMAKIQLRQAYTMTSRAMLAQVDAEAENGRRFDLPDD